MNEYGLEGEPWYRQDHYKCPVCGAKWMRQVYADVCCEKDKYPVPDRSDSPRFYQGEILSITTLNGEIVGLGKDGELYNWVDETREWVER